MRKTSTLSQNVRTPNQTKPKTEVLNSLLNFSKSYQSKPSKSTGRLTWVLN